MRSESPEEYRQKAAERPSYRIENEYNPEAIPQYFQISVGVLEGRNYTWLNPRSANSYVVVILGKKKCRTNIKRNKQEPHYREYFAFGMYASVYDLQRSNLSLTVMEPRCCAPPHLIGEANVDLGAVWRQTFLDYPKAFPKWMQLSLPRDPAVGSMGFIKIDISIKCKGGIHVKPPLTVNNNIEANYLLTSGLEQQHANFIITIHGAIGLPNTPRHHNDKHNLVRSPNTFVRLLFCGLQAKTSVQKRSNNPMYNEQVSMVEMFPSSNPTFRFEICSMDTFASRLLASKSLNLDHISHDGENGFLPTFGPSLLPMFGSSTVGSFSANGDSPFYRGSLLVSLNTVVPYYQQSLRTISVEPVVPICMENLWTLKTFCIFCPIFEVSLLDSRLITDFCGVAITIGEITIDNTIDEDLSYLINELKTRKLHYTGSLEVLRTNSEFGYLDFSNTYPVLQATAQLPDYRYRIYRNNEINKIVRTLKSSLKKVERRLKNVDYTAPKELLEELKKVMDAAANSILQCLNKYLSNYGNTEGKCPTDLDEKQFKLRTEEMKRIREKFQENALNSTQERCDVTRRSIKSLISETYTFAEELERLIFKPTEGWPDVVMWLLNDGSRIGFCKIPVADIIYSDTPEECGACCGRIETIYFKPLKCSKHVNSLSMGCFCNVGKVEFLAWMGHHDQSCSFEPCLPNGHKLKMKDIEMYIKCNGIMVECRIFIYKARLLNKNLDNSGHLFLRIYALNTAQDSKIIEISPTPVWNQLLRIKKMIYSSFDRLSRYPPIVSVELNYTNLSRKSELIGSFQVDSTVDETQPPFPKLRWYEIYKGMENTGKALMSVQILPVPETILKSTMYTQFQECYLASDMTEVEATLSNAELLPTEFIPKTTTYKLDVYWWGLRNLNIAKKPCVVMEVEDIIVKSEIITDKKSNCNFPNSRVSQTFEASFNETFCPTINVKLYDNCTFGRTLYIGASIVKKPNKLFIFWSPKVEREAAMKRAVITSSDFQKVSQTLYVKKKTSIIDVSNECCKESELSRSITNIRTKRSFWRRIFSKNEPEEEEFTLLQTSTEMCTNKIIKKNIIEKRDWWSRYAHSQKIHSNTNEENVSPGDKFVIYDSELERQPQFSKFKDWCANLKVYNYSENTGAAEREQPCGILKAGIAIYKWPPPENTIAVSSSGVDLSRGFFHEYPSNHFTKFLIRVYVIKGIDLVAKSISGKSHPFVIIRCGSKLLGERSQTIPNTCNPIFGTVYELRCTLPEEYQLTVSVYNYDAIESDDLIGSTTIDLENRVYTKHRARVGLAAEYKLSGPGKWRDCIKPSAILEEMCARNHLPLPSFPNLSTVMFNGVEYKDNEEAKIYSACECRENICLNLLHHWDSLPICGHPLVPEHVETRSLYNPEIPGIEQGKIQMWIDIFPIDSGVYIPPAVNITPRKTEEYELKVTIYKAKFFESDTKDEYPKSSNLYVRTWTGFVDQMQSTNSHSICSDGYYVFNCSMIFNFHYDYTERKLVKKKINQFTDFEENGKPELNIQIMDSESVLLDDPVGHLVLNLNEVIDGEKYPECARNVNDKVKILDLFAIGAISGWWQLKTKSEKSAEKIVGAIKLKATLLPKQRTLIMPIGLARDIRSSSIQDTDIRLNRKSSKNNSSVKSFFYKHNALWGSLTGISLIILCIILIIYFILFTMW